MGFPPTRLTLIRRIADGGSEEDWQQFLRDYWGPICRFAIRLAGLSWADAEDVAATTFHVLLRNRLLARWQSSRSARLRTLISHVVRKVVANSLSAQRRRREVLQELIAQGCCDDLLLERGALEIPFEDTDPFYAAWVDDVLQQCVESVMRDCHRSGNGDRFRILYGRLCEGMSLSEICECLGISADTASNQYRAAKRHLARELERHLRHHIHRYCDAEHVKEEFPIEWGQLREYLEKRGGLEESVRRAYLESPPGTTDGARSDSFLSTAALLRQEAQADE